MPRPNSLYAASGYDDDAAEYDHLSASSPPRFQRGHRRTVSAATDDTADEDYIARADDRAVLEEEEEREKLLSRSVFGSLGRSSGGRVRIGKKVKGRKRRAGELAAMMGAKRLGMEDISEGSDESASESDGELLGEKELADKKPRKPTLRRILLLLTACLSFLSLLIAASLYLSPLKTHPPLLTNGTHPYHPTTILISLDGLRASYLSPTLTPHLYNLSRTGLSPPYMLPSFPTLTFPNHYTLATGFLPAHHGIVANTFFSPADGRTFHYTTPSHSLQPFWWTQNPSVSPIWRTHERAGGIAAVHMWPGSETPGLGATHLDRYNSSLPLPTKITQLLHYLDLPTHTRPQLLAAYIPTIDTAGHRFGPDAAETEHALRSVDSALATLSAGLAARNLTHIVSLVLVSDHGMAATSRTRLIPLSSLIAPERIAHFDGWPLYGLRPHASENITAVYEAIRAKHTADAPWAVYTTTTLPARWNFTANPRIAPIWIVPRVGWAVVRDSEIPADGAEYEPRGLHGYDNAAKEMRAVFIASGGKFAGVRETGRNLRVFRNTEVYGIVGESLGLGVEVRGRGDATVEGFEELLVEEGREEEGAAASMTEGGAAHTSVPPPSTDAARPTVATTAAPAGSSAAAIGVDEPKEGGGVGVDEPEGEGEDGRSWWELLKEKARKAKERVQGWWESAWSEGPGEKPGSEKPE